MRKSAYVASRITTSFLAYMKRRITRSIAIANGAATTMAASTSTAYDSIGGKPRARYAAVSDAAAYAPMA